MLVVSEDKKFYQAATRWMLTGNEAFSAEKIKYDVYCGVSPISNLAQKSMLWKMSSFGALGGSLIVAISGVELHTNESGARSLVRMVDAPLVK